MEVWGIKKLLTISAPLPRHGKRNVFITLTSNNDVPRPCLLLLFAYCSIAISRRSDGIADKHPLRIQRKKKKNKPCHRSCFFDSLIPGFSLFTWNVFNLRNFGETYDNSKLLSFFATTHPSLPLLRQSLGSVS